MSENYKLKWVEYLEEIRPDLSIQSKKLYANQLNTIQKYNKLITFDVSKFIHRLVNKSMKDKDLTFITLEGSNQAKNQRLSAVRNILEHNKEIIVEKKYDNLYRLLSSVGEYIRNTINIIAGENIKSKDEEENMKTSWDELNEFAINYTPPLDSTTGLKDHLILNLLLNNYEESNDIKYFVLLRILEYSSLLLWKNKKLPPNDGNNYVWLAKSKLYIQHSKTTGGVKRVKGIVVQQTKNKTYSLSPLITDLFKTYIKKYKLKNGESIFKMTTPQFSKVLINLLKQFGPKMNSTILRKIFENREIPQLNANQMNEMNKNLDHSMSVAQVYYKKL